MLNFLTKKTRGCYFVHTITFHLFASSAYKKGQSITMETTVHKTLPTQIQYITPLQSRLVSSSNIVHTNNFIHPHICFVFHLAENDEPLDLDCRP